MRRLFAVLLLMTFAMTVRADGPVYRVGVENLGYYPIMNFSDTDTNSILRQIMDAFAAAEGIEFEYIPLPIQRFNAWYDDGAIDFRLPDNPYWTSEHDPSLKYSEPVLTLCATVVTLAADQDMPPQAFKRLGTLYGFLPDRKWQQAVAAREVEVVTDSSLRVLTRMLVNGMVDGLDLHISAVRQQGEKLGVPATRFMPSTAFPPTTLGYRLSTREHGDVLARFDRFLASQRSQLGQITDAFSFQEGCAD